MIVDVERLIRTIGVAMSTEIDVLRRYRLDSLDPVNITPDDTLDLTINFRGTDIIQILTDPNNIEGLSYSITKLKKKNLLGT